MVTTWKDARSVYSVECLHVSFKICSIRNTSTMTSWPPEKLNTINVPSKDAILTISASTHIKAPAALVFDVLLDVTSYGQWNTFCPKVTIETQPKKQSDSRTDTLQLGTVFTLDAIMDSKKPDKPTPTQVKVTDISTPSEPSSYIPSNILENDASYTADLHRLYRISWKCEGGFVSRGLKTERFNEVIALNENECVARTWENQGGVLAHTVKWMYKQTLQEKFALWCKDLKRYSEEIASQAQKAEPED